ncbi:hypothetical protein PV327_008681 [Microctonus hyperodae]|uniref:Ribosomal protein S11 n=1 Tax=Microctonus hyperodae TaxID=165561 RepID=A0AA39F3N8_MICHY|nr:hypothetical protein PV327_008681 [Microctonus hyperodae]
MLKSLLNIIKLPTTERLCLQAFQSQIRSSNILNNVNARCMHITSINFGQDRRTLAASTPKKDEGVDGERVVDIDNILKHNDIFPDINTPNKLFNDIPFKEIPIVNIKCTPNNTLMTMSDYKGTVKIIHTCGTEGFKHAKKGTNVAAQATAITLCKKAINMGYKTVRVRIRGLGPGRASSIKGIQMGGLEIISITDYTPVTWNPLRPRKAKRL